MVTVEIALGVVAVMVVIGFVLAVIGAGQTRASLCQAVREGAREASIGQGDPVAVATRSFGHSLDVSVNRSDRWVDVSATAPLSSMLGWSGGQASCSAGTLIEQAVP